MMLRNCLYVGEGVSSWGLVRVGLWLVLSEVVCCGLMFRGGCLFLGLELGSNRS